MRHGDFYSVLSNSRNRMRWFVNEDGTLRAQFRRMRDKKRHQNRTFDPITAVAFLETGKFYGPACFYKAAEVLNLGYNFTCGVTNASDAVGTNKIRRHLLSTVGVRESDNVE